MPSPTSPEANVINETCPVTGRRCPYRSSINNILIDPNFSDYPAEQMQFEDLYVRHTEATVEQAEKSCGDKACGLAVTGAAMAIKHLALDQANHDMRFNKGNYTS